MPISTDMTPKPERRKHDWRVIALFLGLFMLGAVMFKLEIDEKRLRETHIWMVCGELPGRDYAGCRERELHAKRWRE